MLFQSLRLKSVALFIPEEAKCCTIPKWGNLSAVSWLENVSLFQTGMEGYLDKLFEIYYSGVKFWEIRDL